MCIYVSCYCFEQLFVLMNNLDTHLFFYFLIYLDFVTLLQGTTALFSFLCFVFCFVFFVFICLFAFCDIDNILIIWTGKHEDSKHILLKISKKDPSAKFDFEISKTNI